MDRARRHAPWLAALALAVLAGLLPRLARADASRCLPAHALAGLTPAEQQDLATTCTSGTRPAAQQAPLLARLAARASWEAAALAELVSGAAPHLDLGGEPAQAGQLLSVRRALQPEQLTRRGLASAPGCKPLRDAIDAYFADRSAREVPVPPFAAATLDDGRCAALGPDALAGVHLLTIPADATASLFVAAAAGERVTLQWFGPQDIITHAGRRLFVVAVPQWSVVTVRAAPGDDTGMAATWHGFVTHDQTLWDRPPAAGCLRISVDLDADTTLLLDGRILTRGRRLEHRSFGVLAGAHELVALRCAGASACAVRYRETLPAGVQTGTENLCHDVALDLHQPRSVAILRVTAAPGCDAALAWQAAGLASEYLSRNEATTGRVFRDLASYASISEALAALHTSLHQGAGAAVGARTGADSLEVVGTVAKEAWRQGIDELISLELRCVAGRPEDLTLQGSALSVREVFGRARGEVAGLDLRQLLRVQSLEFRSQAQLASTVAGVLDQLLDRSYLRLREGVATFAYRERARVELAAFARSAAEARPELTAHHLAAPHDPAPPLCRALQGPGRAAALQAAQARATASPLPLTLTGAGDDTQPPASEPRTATRLVGSFAARTPGTYLVVARWLAADGRPGPVADATCVRFEVPRRELWASVLVAPDLGVRTPIREHSAFHMRAAFGHTWYLARPWLGLGVAGSYTYTKYASLAGLPSWQDFTVDPAAGAQPLRWRRHALIVGPLLELRTRRARLPVELRARLLAGFGAALVDVRDVAEFPDFSTAASFGPSNLRMRPTLDATLELGVGVHAGPLEIAPMITLGAVAINDMFSAARAVTATSGAALFVGFGLILGGSP